MEELKTARWADEVELEGGALPPSTEVYENDTKILTEYKYEGEKKVKIVRTYKVEKRVFSKSIAVRKTWKKFGESSNDKPGPNPATTIVAEDVYMQYITNKEEENKQEDDGLDKLKGELITLQVFSIKLTNLTSMPMNNIVYYILLQLWEIRMLSGADSAAVIIGLPCVPGRQQLWQVGRFQMTRRA